MFFLSVGCGKLIIGTEIGITPSARSMICKRLTPLPAPVLPVRWIEKPVQVLCVRYCDSPFLFFIILGNTWNHEHIALLGRILTGPEKEAHRIARHLADYVLVWAGGMLFFAHAFV